MLSAEDYLTLAKSQPRKWMRGKRNGRKEKERNGKAELHCRGGKWERTNTK
jgi:hypothetical protein